MDDDQMAAPTKTIRVYLKPGRNGELPFGTYERFQNASVNGMDTDDGRLIIKDASTGDVVALFCYGSWSHIIVTDGY
jgi:hypothetical protein